MVCCQVAWILVSGILLSREGTGDGTEAEYGQKLVSGRPKMTRVHGGRRWEHIQGENQISIGSVQAPKTEGLSLNGRCLSLLLTSGDFRVPFEK